MKHQPVIATEKRNPRTAAIDTLSSLEIVTLINEEDAKVAEAVRQTLPQIAGAVDIIVAHLKQGGRLLYFGAGTSGRIGVLDASEIPPTYNTPPEMVQGIIAGGESALRKSAESAEDNAEAGAALVQSLHINKKDTVVGIAASGNTPWALGAIAEAKIRGAATIGLTCNPNSKLAQAADIAIVPVVGPEVIAGSSRMKAGTAQKMVLNMLSTASMVQLGKVYGNLMVDVRPTNAKLRQRAALILQEAADVDAEIARQTLKTTDFQIKPALVMLLTGASLDIAQQLLRKNDDSVRNAVARFEQDSAP
ncbi:MAG: N-acetylmuramic acid 6-phosphate etherase [Caldilineaceae bacterium]|nr:N-acetylmuramic acid 6-phosphate etherase [Caldilineaceae bacterium]